MSDRFQADPLDDISDLPPLLQEIAEAAGIAVACRMAFDFGGREIYIPSHVSDTHPLVNSLGRTAAERIIKALGPGAVVVPLGLTTHEIRMGASIRKRLAAGESESTISRALRVHIRTVRRHRARMRDSKQTSLFE